MNVVTPAQLLLALAEHGSIDAACEALGGLPRDTALRLLRGIAAALQRPVASDSPAPAAGSRAAAAPSAVRPALAAARPASSAATSAGTSSRPGGTKPAFRVAVFSDGAARGNPGPAGAGAVLLDPDGQVLERLGKFLGRQTNNVAEYEGLLLGLRRAQELGVKAVDVRADSELLIRQLEGRYQVKNAGLKPLHTEALRLLRSFQDFTLRHVPRAQNALADEMSNRAIDERM